VSSILFGILPLSHSSPSYLRTAVSNYEVSLVQTSSAGATQILSSGNTSSLAVGKYSSSGIFITGGGNDLSNLFPTILPLT
nr:hypothetical protein [Tanacetum cinerariifolium]